MNILLWIFVIVGGLVGLSTTLYLIISLPVCIVYKFYRKIRYNISLYD